MSDAVSAVMSLCKRSNKYIDETAPWALAKDEDQKTRLGTVLYNLLESIRFVAVLLTPFMPDTAKSILEQMNCDISDYASLKNFGAIKAGSSVGTPSVLFSRIDAEKMLADIAKEREEAMKTEEKPENVAFLPEISIDEFAKVDLRVAKIKNCEPIKKAKKLLKLTLDDGSGNERIVASGIAQYYTPDELIGRNIIVVANLKPAKLCGVESSGMILAADTPDGVKVIFTDDIPEGSKIR